MHGIQIKGFVENAFLTKMQRGLPYECRKALPFERTEKVKVPHHVDIGKLRMTNHIQYRPRIVFEIFLLLQYPFRWSTCTNRYYSYKLVIQ